MILGKHRQVNQSHCAEVASAGANGIRLAISNPCFELWLILHFQDHTAWLDNT